MHAHHETLIEIESLPAFERHLPSMRPESLELVDGQLLLAALRVHEQYQGVRKVQIMTGDVATDLQEVHREIRLLHQLCIDLSWTGIVFERPQHTDWDLFEIRKGRQEQPLSVVVVVVTLENRHLLSARPQEVLRERDDSRAGIHHEPMARRQTVGLDAETRRVSAVVDVLQS